LGSWMLINGIWYKLDTAHYACPYAALTEARD
jgi:hypothetical protein